MSTETSRATFDLEWRVRLCDEAAGWRRFVWAPVALLVIAAGCSPDDGAPPDSIGEFEGLSREQIEQQLAPMSPAEAERLGIVDTTIRAESPINPVDTIGIDSLLLDTIRADRLFGDTTPLDTILRP